MTSLAARERALLCDLAEQVGPEAPTLCGEWAVKDLFAHLVVRERHPAAIGIFVPALERALEPVQEGVVEDGFRRSVELVRQGPPLWSPFVVPALGDLANTAEYVVHHEDVRRAGETWEPRTLSRRDSDLLWLLVRTLGRAISLKAPVGVVAERTDARARARVRRAPSGRGDVVVRGTPLEILFFLYGRQDRSAVDLAGADRDVVLLTGASLGI